MNSPGIDPPQSDGALPVGLTGHETSNRHVAPMSARRARARVQRVKPDRIEPNRFENRETWAELIPANGARAARHHAEKHDDCDANGTTVSSHVSWLGETHFISTLNPGERCAEPQPPRTHITNKVMLRTLKWNAAAEPPLTDRPAFVSINRR